MKLNKSFFLFVLFFGVLTSCDNIPNELTIDEYPEWFEQHTDYYSVSKKIGELTFTLTFLPQDYLNAKLIRNGSITNISNSTNIYTFNFRVSCEKGNIQEHSVQSLSELQNQLNYFSYKILNDFEIIDDKDKYYALHSIFQSGNGLTPFVDFNVVFSNKIDLTNFVFQYNDKIWGNGNIRLSFDDKNITKYPKLKK